MTPLCSSGESGDGRVASSGGGGSRSSTHCGVVQWGVFGGGQMQLHRHQHETLSPQQLREWYARKGSGGGSSGGRCAAVQLGVSGRGLAQLQRSQRETLTPQQLREWYVQRGTSRTRARCLYVIHTKFGATAELPLWLELIRQGVDVFALDYDVLHSTMYALSDSAEGDCYRGVPPDPGIAAATLGASESGTLPGIMPAEALHAFTLDSGASACFFCDSTTLTPLSAPIPVRLADPSGGPVVARSSTVLPCPAVLFGSLSGLLLPTFSTNLVSTTALQDVMVTTTTHGGQSVSICTCTRTGHHLATFTYRLGSSLYTQATEPPQVAASTQVSASGQVAASCLCRLLSQQTLLTTTWVTPPCHAFVACTLVFLSKVFPDPCLPCRPRLPRPSFLASRGGSAPLLTPQPRALLSTESEGAESGGAEPRGAASSGGPAGAGDAGAGGAGVSAGAGGTRGTAAAGPGGARTRGAGAVGTGGVGGAGAGDPTEPGAPGAGGSYVGRAGAGGARAAGAGAIDPGAGGAGGTVRPRPYFVPLLHKSGGLTERREPASRPVSPVRTACRAPRSRPPPVPSTHAMTLRPSSVPLRVPLHAPPEYSLPKVPDHEFDCASAASPTDSRLLATAVIDTFMIAESASASPPSVGAECALCTDVLEDRQEKIECLPAAVAMDAEMAFWKSTGSYVDEVPPPGANIVDGMWIFRRDYELHSLDFSTDFLQGSLHEEIWLHRPPGFTESFPACTECSLRRPVYGLRQAPREWHDTLRTTPTALGFALATADPSLFLGTYTSLPPFYVLVLQRFGFQFSSPQPTPLSSSH
ncbi:unnamed protein product [Closterium sp. NIES-53]